MATYRPACARHPLTSKSGEIALRLVTIWAGATPELPPIRTAATPDRCWRCRQRAHGDRPAGRGYHLQGDRPCGSGPISDPNARGCFDPHWSPDGTKIVAAAVLIERSVAARREDCCWARGRTQDTGVASATRSNYEGSQNAKASSTRHSSAVPRAGEPGVCGKRRSGRQLRRAGGCDRRCSARSPCHDRARFHRGGAEGVHPPGAFQSEWSRLHEPLEGCLAFITP